MGKRGQGREGEGRGRGREGRGGGSEGRVGAWGTEERGEEGEVKGREGDWCPHMTCLHDAPAPNRGMAPVRRFLSNYFDSCSTTIP